MSHEVRLFIALIATLAGTPNANATTIGLISLVCTVTSVSRPSERSTITFVVDVHAKKFCAEECNQFTKAHRLEELSRNSIVTGRYGDGGPGMAYGGSFAINRNTGEISGERWNAGVALTVSRLAGSCVEKTRSGTSLLK